jgi:hypothetical protein
MGNSQHSGQDSDDQGEGEDSQNYSSGTQLHNNSKRKRSNSREILDSDEDEQREITTKSTAAVILEQKTKLQQQNQQKLSKKMKKKKSAVGTKRKKKIRKVANIKVEKVGSESSDSDADFGISAPSMKKQYANMSSPVTSEKSYNVHGHSEQQMEIDLYSSDGGDDDKQRLYRNTRNRKKTKKITTLKHKNQRAADDNDGEEEDSVDRFVIPDHYVEDDEENFNVGDEDYDVTLDQEQLNYDFHNKPINSRRSRRRHNNSTSTNKKSSPSLSKQKLEVHQQQLYKLSSKELSEIKKQSRKKRNKTEPDFHPDKQLHCLWCADSFPSDDSFEAHLIDDCSAPKLLKGFRKTSGTTFKNAWIHEMQNKKVTKKSLRKKWEALNRYLVDISESAIKPFVEEEIKKRKKSENYKTMRTLVDLAIIFNKVALSVPNIANSSQRGNINKYMKKIIDGGSVEIFYFCEVCCKGYASRNGYKSHQTKCEKEMQKNIENQSHSNRDDVASIIEALKLKNRVNPKKSQ